MDTYGLRPDTEAFSVMLHYTCKFSKCRGIQNNNTTNTTIPELSCKTILQHRKKESTEFMKGTTRVQEANMRELEKS